MFPCIDIFFNLFFIVFCLWNKQMDDDGNRMKTKLISLRKVMISVKSRFWFYNFNEVYWPFHYFYLFIFVQRRDWKIYFGMTFRHTYTRVCKNIFIQPAIEFNQEMLKENVTFRDGEKKICRLYMYTRSSAEIHGLWDRIVFILHFLICYVHA